MSSGFISEKDVAERRQARQEEWQKNKGEEDPEEAPEEAPFDPRTLYDRIQEQRQKKQDEYDEAHKFKNMVRGLEDDEVDFLELVDRSKLQEEKRVRTEEVTAIAEYRKKVSAMQKNLAEEEIRAEIKAAEARRVAAPSKRPSHLTLLAGAIKRKTSEEERQADPPTKKHRKDSNEGTSEGSSGHHQDTPAPPAPATAPAPPLNTPAAKTDLQCIAVLPGLGVYTDSSDSDNNVDSDSDEDDDVAIPHQPRDITGRIVKPVAQCGSHQGC